MDDTKSSTDAGRKLADTSTSEVSSVSPIYVTQPHLPPLEEFIPYLRSIWASKILTNGGPYHQRLEAALCDFLDVDHISLFANGTLALVTALQALRISGEVITTPYSFVATAHALLWNGIRPVFVDIEPQFLTIDPEKIAAAITPQTTAILAVHCYGHPCKTAAIEQIADVYNLRVIYDAAHCFGVRCKEDSLLQRGDMSVLSFHATKVFNTFEGGAIVCRDAKAKQRIDYLKNFGFADDVTVVAPGINGKMSEFNAALGLLQLEYVAKAIDRRGEIDAKYRSLLKGVRGIRCVEVGDVEQSNYAYFPILVEPEYPTSREDLYRKMQRSGIHPRRYFYPLISDFPMYRSLPSATRDNLPVAAETARNVLCLPIYPALDDADVERVAELISQ
jgi:dTDP-4-amino-4,6-dideoxygalactose transaminase